MSDEAPGAGLPEWLTQFDVRTVSLAPPHGGGGTEVRFWCARPLAEVVDHFAERTGDVGDEVEPGRHVWRADRFDGGLRRLRTMVVEAAPGPGEPRPPTDAATVVWVSDLAVPLPPPDIEPVANAGDGPPSRRGRLRRRIGRRG